MPGYEDAGVFRADLRSGPGTGIPDDTGGVRSALSGDGRVALRAEPAWADGSLPKADSENPGAGSLHGRRRGASGGRGSDGDTLRTARGRGDLDGPNFNIDVTPNGYAWWYIDALTKDCTRAISIIGFIGSVFSPWYAWSGRRDPENHVCINVATYGPGGRFTMTDRGRTALHQSRDCLSVGPSSMRWQGDRLVIDIDEIAAPPIVSRVRGQVTVHVSSLTGVELPLDPRGHHVWRPFSPTCHVDVDLNGAGWQWQGHGYFDANFGTRALEQDFAFWTWGRFPTGTGSTCFYDAERRDGTHLEAGIHFGADGTAREIALPPRTWFQRSLWAVYRETRADPGGKPRQVLPMLDAPFYCRSAVETRIDGKATVGVHEALDLRRFRSPLLKPMLAVRVPRRARWPRSTLPDSD